MTTYNCDHCRDTGKRLMPNGEHSDYVDCSCQAATERAELDVAVTVFVQSYEGDLQNAPADTRWFVHQRAVKMQAAKVAALQAKVKELEQKHADAVQRYEELAAMPADPSAPAVEQQPVASDSWLIDGSLVYKLDPTGTMNAFEINVTQAEGSRKSDGPRVELAKRILAWLAAPQAADTDKVREALDGLHNGIMNLPYQMPITKYAVGTEAFIAYKEGHRVARRAAAELCNAASMAAQAPVREVPEVNPRIINSTSLVDIRGDLAVAAALGESIIFSPESMKAILHAMRTGTPLPAAPAQTEPKP